MPGSDASLPDPQQDAAPATPLAPLATDWLCSTLQVDGRVAAVARFRAAASGPGVVPWRYPLEQLEEDWYYSLAAPADGVRAISLQGARILARRLRDATLAIQQRQLARMLSDRSCPFDLHRLLPVPDQVLRLGPDDPASQAWLWAHWGATRALRRVRELPSELDGRRRQAGQLRVELWSADWSPWQALLRLRRAWPDLRFGLRPEYGDDGDD